MLSLGAVSQTRASRENAYQTEKPEEVAISDGGVRLVRRREDLAAVAEAPSVMTTTEAIKLRQDLVRNGAPQLELVALGVAKWANVFSKASGFVKAAARFSGPDPGVRT